MSNHSSQAGGIPYSEPTGRPVGPFDRLEITGVLAEQWRPAVPTKSGWYERVRVVSTPFKSGTLRVEERVQVEMRNGKAEVLDSEVLRAMDARHVLVSADAIESLGGAGIPFEKGRNANYVRVPVANVDETTAVPELVQRLEKLLPGGRIEPDSLAAASAHPNDPVVGNGVAWHLENLGLLAGHRAGADINAVDAWDVRTDASDVLVAVIDSGITSSSSELSASAYLLPGEILGDGIDNDGNGYIDDIRGYDFYSDDAVPEDELGHGSMIAALIGARGNNSIGSTGVAWKSSILNCRFLGDFGLGLLSDAIDAIDYAREAGADVLNLSWSYEGSAPLLEAALQRCEQEGIVMVCASGNSGNASAVPAPASIRLPHLVAVAASTPTDTLAPFSVVDPALVALAAPGVNLPVELGPQPWNEFGRTLYGTGTSFSAALVSGGLALGISEFPAEDPRQVIRRMLESTDPITGGTASLSSGGRLNLGRMLSVTSSPVPHDLFAERGLLTDTAGQWSGRNEGAGVEAIDAQSQAPATGGKTLWFEWEATAAGMVRVQAEAASGTAVDLSVFASANGEPSQLLARSNNASTLEIQVIAGQRLFWRLDSTVGISSDLVLRWHLPPANDNWVNAIAVTGISLEVTGNSLGATVETFESSQSFLQFLPPSTLWWKWTPGYTGHVRLTGAADHLLAVIPIGSGGSPSWPVFPDFIGEEGREIAVSSGASYAVLAVPVSPAAAGSFRWSVAKPEEIVILSQPANTTALEGETVDLRVQATGSNLTYQWFKNDESIPFAIYPTLRLSPVTSRSYGSYHVEISNGITSVESQPILLAARNDVPRLVGQTPRRPVVTGQSLELSATFRSATEVTYAWKKNGQPISGAQASSHAIISAASQDAGTYVLTATNAFGSATATFQLDVVETPWKGWVNRTPGKKGTGRILKVELSGSNASALTSTEWLASTDGGQSWLSTLLPPNLAAESGASRPDGALLVSGGSFRKPAAYYLTEELWRKSGGGSWELLAPTMVLPGEDARAIDTVKQLTYFDGEWWGTVADTSVLRVVHSADGVQWTALANPANPSTGMQAHGIVRYEDRLAISYRDGIMMRSVGGDSKILNFASSGRTVMRIGDANYQVYQTKLFKLLDSQSSPVAVASNWSSSLPLAFSEGIRVGDTYHALESPFPTIGAEPVNRLWFGFTDKSSESVPVGYTCFAKSGANWLVGYPDGTLWVGSDLRTMPKGAKDRQSMNPRLNAYRDEFTYGGFHSSDGAAWQLLGAATNSGTEPGSAAGGRFLHTLKRAYNAPEEKFFSDSIYPVPTGTDTSGSFASWQGESAVLETSNSTAGKITRLVKEGSGSLVSQDVNLGVDWNFVTDAFQIGGRWFARGFKTFPASESYLVTSADGVSWSASSLPATSVVGGRAGALVAIDNAGSAFLSANGVSWQPIIPQGLPELSPINTATRPETIVSYRGYFVARYGTHLYSSADGISWAVSSAPLPAEQLSANRHSLLILSTSGELLQPGGETASGPWMELPEASREITVPWHQELRYEVEAGDADGDLVSVACRVNGQLHSSLSAPPYVFELAPETAGEHAVEFVAADSAGRISRVTAKLTVLSSGVTGISDRVIDADLSAAVEFRGKYYRIHQGLVCEWQGGSLWRPVSPSQFSPTVLVANGEAIIASTSQGMMVSRDGLGWTLISGFGSQQPVLQRDVFHLTWNGERWTSTDGFNWSPPGANTATNEFAGNTAIWGDEQFGLLKGATSTAVTYDGGRLWFTIPNSGVSYYDDVVAVEGAFLAANTGGVYRLQKGESVFTRIINEPSSQPQFALSKVDDLVFLHKAGGYLRSTVDGVQFTEHVAPPMSQRAGLLKFQGQWVAVSSEKICASVDLVTWRTLFTFPSQMHPDYRFQIPVASAWGLDSLRFAHIGFPSQVYTLRPDLTVTAELFVNAPGNPPVGPPPVSGADPRIVSISSTTAEPGVGETIEVRVSAAELPASSTALRFFLTVDPMLGNADDCTLAEAAWDSGAEEAAGVRRFVLTLPPSVSAGRFRVAAQLMLPGGTQDIAIENNQRVTHESPVTIPGYELRLTTTGNGSVNASDARVLYPKGAEVRLQAVPREGSSFNRWEGSMVSVESSISVLMDSDKQLDVLFTTGHQVVIKAVGKGTVKGLGTRTVVTGDQPVSLTQTAGSGWLFDGWRVNGVRHSGATLSFVPQADSLVEGVFVPDFSARHASAFAGAPSGANTSWSGDADGDGISNWHEVLLSSNPLERSEIGSGLEKHADHLRLVYTRPAGPAGQPWVAAEFSEKLTGWSQADSNQWSERILQTVDGIETVEVVLPFRAGTTGFFRLSSPLPPVE